jgi:hypothetical protein
MGAPDAIRLILNDLTAAKGQIPWLLEHTVSQHPHHAKGVRRPRRNCNVDMFLGLGMLLVGASLQAPGLRRLG